MRKHIAAGQCLQFVLLLICMTSDSLHLQPSLNITMICFPLMQDTGCAKIHTVQCDDCIVSESLSLIPRKSFLPSAFSTLMSY